MGRPERTASSTAAASASDESRMLRTNMLGEKEGEACLAGGGEDRGADDDTVDACEGASGRSARAGTLDPVARASTGPCAAASANAYSVDCSAAACGRSCERCCCRCGCLCGDVDGLDDGEGDGGRADRRRELERGRRAELEVLSSELLPTDRERC